MQDSEDGLHALGSIEYTPPSDENTNIARELVDAFRRHSDRVLIVDTQSKREWTGARLLDYCGRFVNGLVRQVGLKPGDVVMTICDHNDKEIAMALSAIIAGGALFGTAPRDGYSEIETLCNIVQPDVFIISGKYHERARMLRQNVPQLSGAKIVWLDKPSDELASIQQQQQQQQQQVGATSDSLPIHKQNGDCNSVSKQLVNGIDANNNNNIDIDIDIDIDLNIIDQQKLIVERDQVYLAEQFVSGPCDMQLVESLVNKQIDAQEHIVSYMLTSGSTGRPKVVPSTHSELVHGLYSMISACTNPMPKQLLVPQTQDEPAVDELLLDSNNNNNNYINESNGNSNGNGVEGQQKDNVRKKNDLCLMPIGPDEIVSGDLPLDHGAGLNTMFLSLWMGARFIVMPSYDVDAFWQAVNDYKISASIASTTFCYNLFSRLKQLIDTNQVNRWNLSSFKFISCCGAKLAFIDLISEVLQHYKHIQVSQAYGCTEVGFISMVHRADCKTHLHSTGHLFPGLVAKVVSRDGPPGGASRQLGPNERGELLIWARSKFKGYRCHKDDNPARIYADCHDDKGVFYRTGDQAHFDKQRRLYIHGRFKDTLYLDEDWKILPVELEDVVNEHPLVEMSAVVGVPYPNLPGFHAPKAFVKLIPLDSAQASLQSSGDKELCARLAANDFQFIQRHIYDFVASKTAQPKHLKGGVRILDEFPRVGLLNKIDRKALLQMD